MPALQIDLKIQQGASFRRVFRWLDAAGNPKSFTGWTAFSQIKSAYGVKQSIIDLSTATGEILLPLGYVILQLTDEQTRSIPVFFKDGRASKQSYYYDTFLYDPDGNAKRIFVGNAIVTGALSNAI